MSLTLQPPQTIATIPGRRTARWVLAAYWLLLVCGTHWPKDHMPGESRYMPADKRLHFMAYGVLAALLTFVIVPRSSERSPVAVLLREIFTCAALAVGIAVAFGLVDEATQPWTGRFFEWADWRADILGATLGASVVGAAIALRTRKRGVVREPA